MGPTKSIPMCCQVEIMAIGWGSGAALEIFRASPLTDLAE